MFVADELGFDDFAYFAWDARGHGNSPGERGDSPSMATSIADIQDFVHHIEREYGIPTENIAVIAQSVGAVLVSAYTIMPQNSLRSIGFACFFKVKLMSLLPAVV